jgi:hypothetical protein
MMEERAYINLCFKTRKRVSETLQLINRLMVTTLFLSPTQISEWYARSQDSHENLKDDKYSK